MALDSSNGLYEDFIAISRYARWLPEEQRRESYQESVLRYFDCLQRQIETKYPQALAEYQQHAPILQELVQNKEVLPSMRMLMTAGRALERDNVAGYNCAYAAIDDYTVFDELMYCLMCGTGVGFSVEQKYLDKLPVLPKYMRNCPSVIDVRDSKIGWCSAFRELISLLREGRVPQWDLSKIRPEGEPLKTFGGRASGPAPLEELFEYTVKIFTESAGKRLASYQAHDLMCKIGEIVVVGGVRRSAEISLSDLDDAAMRFAKTNGWWAHSQQRALSNNSAVFEGKPEPREFYDEWQSIKLSGSGERGIFNREACQTIASTLARRPAEIDYGCNPCSEIILRSKQFCNLTEVVVRESDDDSDLRMKVAAATILGTIQATFTDFRYLSDTWKHNCDEERLLGVSLTGIYDNPALWDTDNRDVGKRLQHLKEIAKATNRVFARTLAINPSAAITCVKPSGTASQLAGSASGIHPRYSEYYIRNVRQDNKDPVTALLKDAGVPHEPDQTAKDHTTVFSFPMASPKGSQIRDQVSAIDQLELWLTYQKHWCEHKPSCTVYIKDDEWDEVGNWVYQNFEWMSGVAFLPYDGGTYSQAPYQEITEEQYNRANQEMPMGIDWGALSQYEKDDHTTASQELACHGGVCEL